MKLPDTGEAGARRRDYPDTGEAQKKLVAPEPIALEKGVQESEQKEGTVKTKWPIPPGEPLWLTVWHTIFGFVVISFLLYGLWLFIRS